MLLDSQGYSARLQGTKRARPTPSAGVSVGRGSRDPKLRCAGCRPHQWGLTSGAPFEGYAPPSGQVWTARRARVPRVVDRRWLLLGEKRAIRCPRLIAAAEERLVVALCRLRI